MLGRKPTLPMTTKTAKTALALMLAVFVVFGAGLAVAHAQGVTAGEILPESVGAAIGTGTTDIRITIARIIRVALGLLGIIAVLLVLYAGFIWMTAAGNPDRVTKAKQILSAAVIGLVIVITAFGIVSFIIRQLLGALEGAPGGGVSSAGSEAACIGLSATCPAGALGNGIVESHYPTRNAIGIPRNTRVVVTFKEKIKPETIVVGGGDDATVAILKSGEVSGVSNQFPQKFAASLTSDQIDVQASEDGKTFVFVQKNCPDQCLGSPTENVFYTVGLRGGGSGIKKEDGTAAFAGTFNSGYLWEFQTSTKLDTEPPKVLSVAPADGSTGNPRNTLIQINFNEPVDPVSVKTIGVTYASGTIIPGEQQIGNGYRSVEFRTEDLCGTNSCGEPVYCLPKNAVIATEVKADGLSTAPPAGVFPPNGITDMAGNSLDGNADGIAQGPPDDDKHFVFSTNDAIDLVPPKIVSQQPAILEPNIARDSQIGATFSKLMSLTSFTSDSARLISSSPDAPTNYWLETENVSSVADAPSDQTTATFLHDLLSTNQMYSSSFTSGIRDLHQNCYFPPANAGDCSVPEGATEPVKKYCCNGSPSDAECGF